MRVLASRKGFSLVELLTVIAIIAILASIIFPVMGLVSNKARMNKCVTQLHEIGVAVQYFKTDNRQYPDILGIPVLTTNSATPAADGSNVVSFDQIRDNTTGISGLYPEYVRSFRLYHCPMSKIIDTKIPEWYDPGKGGLYGYSYNSYDFYKVAPGDVRPHYLRSWAVITGTETPAEAAHDGCPINPEDPARAARDYERQLKFRNPPDDTVVTWCSWHEVASGTSVRGKTPVLFLDGHVDGIDAAIVETERWRTQPKKE